MVKRKVLQQEARLVELQEAARNRGRIRKDFMAGAGEVVGLPVE